MTFAFSQMTCDKLHQPLKDGVTYQCPFCYAAKKHALVEQMVDALLLAKYDLEAAGAWGETIEAVKAALKAAGR